MAREMLNPRYVVRIGVGHFDRHKVDTMDYQVIAESIIHLGRRLLVGGDGDGYIQLAIGADPIAVPEHDFIRLLAMRHYRIVPADLYLDRFPPIAVRDQVAD